MPRFASAGKILFHIIFPALIGINSRIDLRRPLDDGRKSSVHLMEEINILLINNKKEDAVLLEQMLEKEGYKIWVVTNPEEAVRLLKETFFAVVVTELEAGGMNGIEITREVLKCNANISVVVITEQAVLDQAIRAMEEGAYGYVTRPFNAAEVKVVLKRAVEKFYLLFSDKEKERFVELSVKDGLTGVYNHRFFKLYLENKISFVRRTTDKFSLLMIDLDFFKKFNDSNGHLAGDELLHKMSKIFRESVRQEDVVFRYGGEEFVVFLEHTDKEQAALVAERIRNTATLFMPVTISIGVGTFPEDGRTLEELINSVDAILYKAKNTGRNKVCTCE